MSRPTTGLVYRDPATFSVLAGLLSLFTRVWFRFRLLGKENLPDVPALYVANHSGLGHVDALCLIGAWYHVHGAERQAVGMMSDVLVDVPGIGHFARALGAVNASPENARTAFRDGHSVLVFPGGELDCCRPLTLPRTVIFGPRRGYARLALEAGVPVVPIATLGSHWTCPILPGGAFVARLFRPFGLRCDRAPLPLPLLLSVVFLLAGALGWMPAPLAAVLAGWVWFPWPFPVRSRILPPIDVVGATAHLPEDERVEAAHLLIHGALQTALRERTWPS